MENNNKTNKLATISFVCGLIALISIAIIFAAYNLTEPTQGLLFITDGILMPIRNISVVVALVTGIIALRNIKKMGHTEKGKGLAWAGIVISTAIILSGVLVGLVFLLSTILQSW